MDRKKFESIREYVLNTMLEMNILDGSKVEKALTHSDLLYGEDGVTKAREFLLKIVQYEAGRCTACDRHCQRVRACVGEGSLDSPMLVGDYPGYVDTMCGRPLPGNTEAIQSYCFACGNFELHFGKAVFPQKTELMTIDDPSTMCRRVSLGDKMTIPPSMQGLDKSLNPFGTPGQILDRILLDLGRKREGWGDADIYITNSLLCPSLDEKGEHKPVYARQRKACDVWLRLQAKVVNPPIIVCMGNHALKQLFPKNSVTEMLGTLNTANEIEAPVGVTWHPGTVLRAIDNPKSGEVYGQILEHLSYYFSEPPLKEINNG